MNEGTGAARAAPAPCYLLAVGFADSPLVVRKAWILARFFSPMP
jgi:hypothetical protein